MSEDCNNCHECLKGKEIESPGGFKLPATSSRMILCPDCGNKRCPKATNHRFPCTGSNEPGQPGSIYKHVWKDRERKIGPDWQETPVGWTEEADETT